ncbi:MAG: ABC transporter substrate-binding protein [Moorea sp. SIO2B7]|nr:ABC transporter substrate-binding protein [Moorena sp. SIO2B7]
MKRRRFLKNTGLGAAGLAFSACQQLNFADSENEQKESPLSKPAVGFGKLEKTNLVIGIVPTISSTPLVIAKEKGFFARYGLKVNLSRQTAWGDIEKGLRGYRFDAIQATPSMPILAQLGRKYAPMVSLMMLNRNGSAITLDQKAWKGSIRPSIEYVNFSEFAIAFRKYLRGFGKQLKYAIDSPASMNGYNFRYWLATMGIEPDKEVDLVEFPPLQMIHKIQAGIINGYCVAAPWDQQSVLKKAGFTAYVSRDIWQGHPGNVLAAMIPWVEKHPTTARALVAAVLEACQFCDRSENRSVIAQILSQKNYLNTDLQLAQSSVAESYNYGGFDQKNRVVNLPDYNIFHDQETDYLKKPDHANYPWLSHGVWLLTQMIRWNQIKQREYPKNADKILERIYPIEIYKDVAGALKIELPSDRMKIESAQNFIDQRKFDPSQPVMYLNQFDLRANRPQFLAL